MPLNLHPFAGRQGYLEVTDGDNGDAYAWLAVGRFDPPVVAVPNTSPNVIGQRQQAAAELSRDLALSKLEAPLAELFGSDRAEVGPRAAAARALLELGGARTIPSVALLLRNGATPDGLRAKLGAALAEQGSQEALAALVLALREAPQRLQVQLAAALAGRKSISYTP